MIGFSKLIGGGGSLPPLGVTYVGSNGSSSDAEDYTFSSASLGTNTTSDYWLITCGGRAGNADRYVVDVTIDGQIHDVHWRPTYDSTGKDKDAILSYMALVPCTGSSTGTILIDGAGGNWQSGGYSLFVLTGLQSTTAINEVQTTVDVGQSIGQSGSTGAITFASLTTNSSSPPDEKPASGWTIGASSQVLQGSGNSYHSSGYYPNTGDTNVSMNLLPGGDRESQLFVTLR